MRVLAGIAHKPRLSKKFVERKKSKSEY